MKRLALAVAVSACAASAALAADMAPPPPIPKAPPPPPYNWSGFYVGGNLGAGWNNINITDTAGNSFSGSSSTQFVGGGQVGLNYQFPNYQFWGGAVIGIEADFDWLPNTNNTTTATIDGLPASVAINNRWLTTVTGRFGYAFDRVFAYAKGGAAWVGASNPSIAINGVAFAPSTSSTNIGWTAGFGVEWAFAGTWSVRAEYDYVGLNNQTFVVPAAAPALAGDVISTNNRNFQMVTAGINYKFGW